MQHQLFATPASLSAVAAEPPRRLFAGHEGMAKKRSSNDNCSGGLWTRHWRTGREPGVGTIPLPSLATAGLTEAGYKSDHRPHYNSDHRPHRGRLIGNLRTILSLTQKWAS